MVSSYSQIPVESSPLYVKITKYMNTPSGDNCDGFYWLKIQPNVKLLAKMCTRTGKLIIAIPL